MRKIDIILALQLHMKSGNSSLGDVNWTEDSDVVLLDTNRKYVIYTITFDNVVTKVGVRNDNTIELARYIVELVGKNRMQTLLSNIGE